MTHERALDLLTRIYGPEIAGPVLQDLIPILAKYKGHIPPPRGSGLSERDAILITYADQVQEPDAPGLATLREFCELHLDGLVSGIHILPFYPWSSDDGFSVIDYEQVAPQYGTWEDIRRLGAHFRLMFDAVINHASAQSAWFQGYLRDQPDLAGFFIDVHGEPDLSNVVRPRALPLLTAFDAQGAQRKIWTTFSADQVDLDYHNPRVLLKILDILLFYASQGAEFVRLDAIAYLWKEPGTSCINLPQTHWVVQLMRFVLDEAAPHVMLITETNVPNLENLSYFGDGRNEAQLVYNFPMPPLVLHALQTGSANMLSRWAATLELPSTNVTFLNFLASHDGIGLNPVRGILRESEIQAMAERVERGGGYISNKLNANGTLSPYEMNMNYFDALACSDFTLEREVQVQRFVTAHAILMSFMGVPALYFHSLFGSRGWPEGVHETQKYRAINREKLQRGVLESELMDPASLRSAIFGRLGRLLRARSSSSCFAPHVPQHVVECPPSAFAIIREQAGTGQAILCVHNVTPEGTSIKLNLARDALTSSSQLRDMITGKTVRVGDPLVLDLAPYETLWLST